MSDIFPWDQNRQSDVQPIVRSFCELLLVFIMHTEHKEHYLYNSISTE